MASCPRVGAAAEGVQIFINVKKFLTQKLLAVLLVGELAVELGGEQNFSLQVDDRDAVNIALAVEQVLKYPHGCASSSLKSGGKFKLLPRPGDGGAM